MYSSIPVCIVCLKTSLEYIDFDTPFEVNSSDESSKSLTYLDCFTFCTRLNVQFTENVPQSLCSSCGLELKVAYEFIKRAASAAEELRQAIEQTKLDSENSQTLVEELNVSDFENETYEETEEKHLYDDGYSDLEKTFVCTLCGDQLYSQLLLNLHINRLHKSNYLNPEENSSETEMLVSLIEADEEISPDSFGGDNQQDSKKQNHIKLEETLEDVSQEFIDVSEEDQVKLIKEELEEELVEKQNNKTTSVSSEHNIIVHVLSQQDNSKKPKSAYRRCEVCTRLVIATTYETHMNIHKGHKSFECEDCTRSFYSRRALQLHYRNSHRSKATNTCKICGIDVSEKTMKSHIQQQHTRLVSCAKCDYKSEEVKIRDHMRKSHSDSRDFLCNVCSKTFATLGILNAHLKNHERKLGNYKSDACEICGKQFSTKHYLRAHMEVHKNDRQLFNCGVCDKMYVSKTALDNHLKLHKGDTIKCLLCSKEFARQYELNVHMRFHTRDYPFECEICKKKFAIKGHLRTHMWRHQGLKLQCEECGKLFTSTKALQEHSFIHSEMPFTCPYCAKGYPSKQKFKVHLKTAHLVELPDSELQKLSKNPKPKQLVRKKVTLVQADAVMKEVVIKMKTNEEDEELEHL